MRYDTPEQEIADLKRRLDVFRKKHKEKSEYLKKNGMSMPLNQLKYKKDEVAIIAKDITQILSKIESLQPALF